MIAEWYLFYQRLVILSAIGALLFTVLR